MPKQNQTAKDFWKIVETAADAAASPGGGMNYNVGFNAFTADHAKRLADSEIVLILEQLEGWRKQPGNREIRAVLLAEQGRRSNLQHSQLMWITVATLIVAVIGVAAQLFS